MADGALLCLYCSSPMEPAKRARVAKLFCCDRHRVAYRDANIRNGLRQVAKLLQELDDSMNDLAAMQAQIQGAMVLLGRALRTTRRKPQPSSQIALDGTESDRKD